MSRWFIPPGNTSQQDGGSLILDRVLTAVVRAFDALDNALTFDRTVVAAIGTTDTRVYHGLGFQPHGYLIAGLSADARVWRGTDDGQQTAYLNLKASAPVTATLVFY